MRKPIIILSIILVINLFSLYYSWYSRWDWFDISQHIAGGLFVAMLMSAYLREHLRPQAKIKNALIIAGATVFIGVSWEFMEYIANQTMIEPFYRWFGVRAYFMGDLNDTVNDLLMDNLGALSFIIWHFIWSRDAQ